MQNSWSCFISLTSPSLPGAALHSDIRWLYCSRVCPFVTLQAPLFSHYNSAAAQSFITIASISICYCIIPKAVNAKSLMDISTWNCVAFFFPQTSFSPKVWRDYPPKQYQLCYDNFFLALSYLDWHFYHHASLYSTGCHCLLELLHLKGLQTAIYCTLIIFLLIFKTKTRIVYE